MLDPKELAESGALLVDKPTEWTSHDVVNFVRKRFRVEKVGHCGTLDPAATGLLVLVLGKATRLSEKFSGHDKVYAGTMRLGTETDSQDRDGKVIAEKGIAGLTEAQLREAAKAFVGDLQQIPPMVSAVKVNGRPLYKLARKGQVIERASRPVTIHAFDLSRVELPDADFEVRCTKGTYVRTLCSDLGDKLGCGAYLLALRRLRSGPFDIKDAVTLDTLKTWERPELLKNMIPILTLAGMMQA